VAGVTLGSVTSYLAEMVSEGIIDSL